MKFKELLSYSTIICSLLGCGTSFQDQNQESENTAPPIERIREKILSKLDHEARRELQGYIKNYLFTHAEFEPYSFRYSISNAILSKAAKSLVKRIWSPLQKLGFEGYSPAVLDRNTVRFSYSEPEVLIGSRISGIPYEYQEPSFVNASFHERVMIILMEGRTGIQYLMPSNKEETDFFSLIFIGLSINGQPIGLHHTSTHDLRPYGSHNSSYLLSSVRS